MADASEIIKWTELMTAGAKSLEEERYAEAVESFGEAANMGREMAQAELLAFSLRMLGNAKNHLGEYEEARKALSESLELARKIENLRGQAEALAGLASVAYCLEDSAVAEDLFLESIAVFAGLGDELRKAMLLCDLGAVYCSSSGWEKAFAAYNEALELCRRLGEKHGQAEILVMIGELCRRQGFLEESAVHLQAGALVFMALEDWRNTASTLQYLGLTYHDLGDLERAVDSHRRALVLWLEINETEEVALVLFALGKLYQALGQLDEAEESFLQSLNLVKEHPEAAGYRRQNLASLYLLRKDIEEAGVQFKAALEYFQAAGNWERAGEMLENLGFLQEIAGNSTEAERYYLEALEEYRKCGSKKGMSLVFRSLGQLYEGIGQEKRALENLWQALNLFRELELKEMPLLEKEIQHLSRRIRRGNG